MSPLLNNEQESRVQIDRVPHSAVSVVAMTSSVAALHFQLTGEGGGAYNTKRRDFLECVDFYNLLKIGEMEVILLEYVNLTYVSPVTNRGPDRTKDTVRRTVHSCQ